MHVYVYVCIVPACMCVQAQHACMMIDVQWTPSYNPATQTLVQWTPSNPATLRDQSWSLVYYKPAN